MYAIKSYEWFYNWLLDSMRRYPYVASILICYTDFHFLFPSSLSFVGLFVIPSMLVRWTEILWWTEERKTEKNSCLYFCSIHSIIHNANIIIISVVVAACFIFRVAFCNSGSRRFRCLCFLCFTCQWFLPLENHFPATYLCTLTLLFPVDYIRINASHVVGSRSCPFHFGKSKRCKIQNRFNTQHTICCINNSKLNEMKQKWRQQYRTHTNTHAGKCYFVQKDFPLPFGPVFHNILSFSYSKKELAEQNRKW